MISLLNPDLIMEYLRSLRKVSITLTQTSHAILSLDYLITENTINWGLILASPSL